MKKAKFIAGLCMLILTIACLTFGVYSAVKTTFTASGTITFNNYGIDADIQIDIYGVENGTTIDSTDANNGEVTGLKKRTVKATTTESRKTGDIQIISSSTAVDLGELKFDELNTTVAEEWKSKIVLVISFTNYSKFDAQLSITQESAAITNLTATYGSKIKATKSTDGTTGVTSTSNLAITLAPTDKSIAITGATFTPQITLKPYKLEKGDLLTMDLVEGTEKITGFADTYRVLKIDENSNIVEVVAMYECKTQQYYSPTGTTSDASGNTVTKYDGSSLDKYLNTTWYGTLSADAKAAIVKNNITQYSYGSGSYNATTHASDADYSSKSVVYQDTAKTVTTLTRNIYALDVEDIYEYFKKADGTYSFSTADIWKLFWNADTKPSIYSEPFLRSAGSADSINVWYISRDYGRIGVCDNFDERDYRPAFKIDLSKIDWA